MPNTGTLAGDLQEFARQIAATIGSDRGARTTRAMVSAAATSDEGAVGMNAFWAERLASSSVIVGRAIERGDVAESTDANLVIETLIGPLWFRLLLTGEPIDNDFADRVAELVARGATATPVTADPHVGPAPPSAGFGEP